MSPVPIPVPFGFSACPKRNRTSSDPLQSRWHTAERILPAGHAIFPIVSCRFVSSFPTITSRKPLVSRLFTPSNLNKMVFPEVLCSAATSCSIRAAQNRAHTIPHVSSHINVTRNLDERGSSPTRTGSVPPKKRKTKTHTFRGLLRLSVESGTCLWVLWVLRKLDHFWFRLSRFVPLCPAAKTPSVRIRALSCGLSAKIFFVLLGALFWLSTAIIDFSSPSQVSAACQPPAYPVTVCL
jgi:hypothetical protein